MRGLIGVDIRSVLPIQYVSLRDMIVTQNRKDGILSRNTGGNHVIEDCRISRNGSYAVNAHQFSGSVIRNCRVFDNQNGLRFGWGWDIRIQDNFVYHNKNAGVYPDSCYSSTIERNLIYANGVGIEMGYIAGHNTLRENIILENKQGIQIDLEGRDLNYNRFYHNAIVNNTVPVGDSPKNIAGFQQWDNGLPHGGNFWSNYTGRDEDQDGIGDTPHQFLSNARDDYPLMKARTLIQAEVALVVEQWNSRDRQAKISAFISLPAGIPPHEIDVPTVVLNGTLRTEESTFKNQDQEGIGSPSLNVRFDWAIPPSISLIDESIELSIFGYLKSGIAFTGSSFVNITER
jgi:parallel beta-helix repeat protein